MASPAIAQERTADIRLPEMRLDAAVRMLSRQSGASIGFRDPSLASVRVRAVRGKLTASAALERALRGTGARARQVAAATQRRSIAPAILPQPISQRVFGRVTGR
ncbi:STN domain-containing protein, partial [Sphingomonas koreensis]|uniref:STN domain-containing protein n=1 Tax=Sphingomonas koreensis TaxID=93064 RepID=UPI0019D17B5E